MFYLPQLRLIPNAVNGRNVAEIYNFPIQHLNLFVQIIFQPPSICSARITKLRILTHSCAELFDVPKTKRVVKIHQAAGTGPSLQWAPGTC